MLIRMNVILIFFINYPNIHNNNIPILYKTKTSILSSYRMNTMIEKKDLFIKNIYLYSDSTSHLSLQNTAFTKEKKDWIETLDSSFQYLIKKIGRDSTADNYRKSRL